MDTKIRPTLTTAGDACTGCGTTLAADQRYCVQCGRRRGTGRRPAFESMTATREVVVSSEPHPRPPWRTSSATFVAGIATLLLAMGVGVLIGRSAENTGSPRSAAAAPVRVVTVGGTAAAAAATPAANTAASTTRKKAKKAKVATPKPATSKVKGTNLKLPAKAVVKVGSPGTGPGYQHGKFTGNFFGGGG